MNDCIIDRSRALRKRERVIEWTQQATLSIGTHVGTRAVDTLFGLMMNEGGGGGNSSDDAKETALVAANALRGLLGVEGDGKRLRRGALSVLLDNAPDESVRRAAENELRRHGVRAFAPHANDVLAALFRKEKEEMKEATEEDNEDEDEGEDEDQVAPAPALDPQPIAQLLQHALNRENRHVMQAARAALGRNRRVCPTCHDCISFMYSDTLHYIF